MRIILILILAIVFEFQYTENKRVYDKSNAILKILKELPFPWSLSYLPIIVIPKRVRDYIYELIARNRYRWFGIRNECSIPNKKKKYF